MIVSKFLKVAAPISCILLLCSCGKANNTKTESTAPKTKDSSISTTIEKVQINLTDYFHNKYEGYDTFGYSTQYGVNVNQMIVDHPAAFGLPEPYTEDSASNSVLNDLLKNIDIDSLERLDHYSNGDVIKINWSENYKAVNDNEKYNVEFVPGSSEFTVSGLTELQEIDPFEKIQVSFSEIDGKAVCSITGNEPEIECVLDKEDFKMGDTVKITLVSRNNGMTIEDIYAENGLKPIPTEKEYKAE